MDSQKTFGGLSAKEIAVLQEFSEASRRQGGVCRARFGQYNERGGEYNEEKEVNYEKN